MYRKLSFHFKFLVLAVVINGSLLAQLSHSELRESLAYYNQEWKRADFNIQSSYYDSILKCTHYYVQELINGVEVYPELANLHFDDNKRLICSHINKPRFNQLSKFKDSHSERKIIESYLSKKNMSIQYTKDNGRQSRMDNFTYYQINNKIKFKVKSCYYFIDPVLRPALRIILEDQGQEAQWDVFIDRLNLDVIKEVNTIHHCGSEVSISDNRLRIQLEESHQFNNNCYKVYNIPVESPLHGSRNLISAPWLKASNASPLGWHNDGQFIFQHTIGNNVDCYEDMDADNQPTGGNTARTFGGSGLNFDFTYDVNQNPIVNKNSALSNLFYWNNILHDILYQYGFNESSGNFQYNNFGNGGLDLDNIIAEGLDNINGARNNASFSCPPDGYPGRMQMYTWQLPVFDTILIETPNQIYGNIVVVHSAISPSLFGPYRSEIVLANDGSSFPNQGCNPYINASQINGKIAMIDRGICSLNDKITNAQLAGAIALIVCSVDDNAPTVMGGFSSGVGLPVMNISKSDGDKIKSYLNQGVQIVMKPSSALKFTYNNKNYEFARAAFGAKIPSQLNAGVVSVIDANGNINDACDPIVNNIANSICLIEDGNCDASYKAYQAQLLGAQAVVIGRNTSGLPIVFPSGSYGHLINIPVICISKNDYIEIRNQLPNNARLVNNLPQLVDASFDGGIIAHEYAHGLSIRLTGGPNNSSCLNNAEQGGEGWSDFFGLMTTIKLGDFAYTNRSIGVWPSGQTIESNGIRPTPYNVDKNINPAHYGMMTDRIKISQPHGIGYLWCSMLWDLNWAMVKSHGYEPDIYKANSIKGNIKAINLVVSGLKLQKCSPGFVDARNAILKADTILYNGSNACVLWNVFARRGLGWSANQGSSQSRDDGIAAYDLPSSCSLMTDIQLFGNQILAIDEVVLEANRNNSNQVVLNWDIISNDYISKIEIIRIVNKQSKIIEVLPGGFYEYTDSFPPNEKLIYQVKVYSHESDSKLSNKVIVPYHGNEQWNYFPNPVNNIMYLENHSIVNSKLNIQIVDLHGKHISNSEILYKSKDKIRLDFTNLIRGVYFVFIESEEGVEKIKVAKN